MKARLLLEDGTYFVGTSFGASGEVVGEVVFNTSMTGYQEIMTAPSYTGQLITMTYPLIGSYGINHTDSESLRPHGLGLIVKEYAQYMSNWRAQIPMHEWLQDHGVMAISGIDTRMVTRKIRDHGTMRALLTTYSDSLEELQTRLQNTPIRADQVKQVSTKSIHIAPSYGKRVVLMDFGTKHNIQRELVERGCEVVTVPYNTTAEEILRFHPAGVILSNGPGNPKDVPEAVKTIRQLMGKIPIFGICLGHLLLALACGADTVKMKFGHRGGNQPVKELETGRTIITSQNHGYAVCKSSLQGTALRVSHLSLHDETIEGLVHETLPAFSIQYHPESAPGPLDSGYLFDRFQAMMQSHMGKGVENHA